jgi:hypothetical protein
MMPLFAAIEFGETPFQAEKRGYEALVTSQLPFPLKGTAEKPKALTYVNPDLQAASAKVKGLAGYKQAMKRFGINAGRYVRDASDIQALRRAAFNYQVLLGYIQSGPLGPVTLSDEKGNAQGSAPLNLLMEEHFTEKGIQALNKAANDFATGQYAKSKGSTVAYKSWTASTEALRTIDMDELAAKWGLDEVDADGFPTALEEAASNYAKAVQSGDDAAAKEAAKDLAKEVGKEVATEAATSAMNSLLGVKEEKKIVFENKHGVPVPFKSKKFANPELQKFYEKLQTRLNDEVTKTGKSKKTLLNSNNHWALREINRAIKWYNEDVNKIGYASNAKTKFGKWLTTDRYALLRTAQNFNLTLNILEFASAEISKDCIELSTVPGDNEGVNPFGELLVANFGPVCSKMILSLPENVEPWNYKTLVGSIKAAALDVGQYYSVLNCARLEKKEINNKDTDDVDDVDE